MILKNLLDDDFEFNWPASKLDLTATARTPTSTDTTRTIPASSRWASSTTTTSTSRGTGSLHSSLTPAWSWSFSNGLKTTTSEDSLSPKTNAPTDDHRFDSRSDNFIGGCRSCQTSGGSFEEKNCLAGLTVEAKKIEICSLEEKPFLKNPLWGQITNVENNQDSCFVQTKASKLSQPRFLEFWFLNTPSQLRQRARACAWMFGQRLKLKKVLRLFFYKSLSPRRVGKALSGPNRK